ncbi:MAG: LysR substrate-binding domain-containing protein [Pseudomonadota bacterium]
MPSSPYDLPPPTMLRAFEAAARREAFNEAAGELNVTPGAISHQVKALERELGVRLFDRGHRRVHLTQDGRELYDVLRRGFVECAQTVARLRTGAETWRLDIAATTAFSQLWLTPRLIAFWKENDHVLVNQHLTDRPMGRPLPADLAVEYRLEPPSDPVWTRLFGDTLVPVAAPGHPPVAGPELLARQPLIHLDAREENWTTWGSWFALMGYRGPVGMARRVNNYSIAAQLAAEGAGFALGWKRLLTPMIAAGTLHPLDHMAIEAPGAFYLICRTDDPDPAVRLMFDWMADHVS